MGGPPPAVNALVGAAAEQPLPRGMAATSAESPSVAVEEIARGNEELAGYVAQAPGRLVALGSVPLGWPGAAAEARRCLDDLGMAGIAIGSRGAGRDLDHPAYEDLWALLAERRAFVFLHPSGVPDGHRLRDFYLSQLAGYPMETALAVSRLIFTVCGFRAAPTGRGGAGGTGGGSGASVPPSSREIWTLTARSMSDAAAPARRSP